MGRATVWAVALLTASATVLAPTGAQARQQTSSATSSRLALPSPPDVDTRVRTGTVPGEVTITLKTAGLNTDLFRVTTATSPFKDGARDKHVFKLPFTRKAGTRTYTYTLTKSQTAEAGAGIGVAWTLVWRVQAVNVGADGSRRVRYFGQGQVRVPGQAAVGEEPLRIASYNVRKDATFNKRAALLGAQILSAEPGIVAIQELFTAQVADFKTGLTAAGNNDRYVLTRETNLGNDNARGLQSRILYESDNYELLSDCTSSKLNCVFPMKVPGDDPEYGTFAKFRDISTQQTFWVVSLHLVADSTDADRTKQMEDATDYVNQHFNDGSPVIVAGDVNSSQLRAGRRPHDVLMSRGYYDTASTVTHVNPEYFTANAYKYLDASGFNPAPRIDLIAVRGMTGSDHFENMVIFKPDPFPSDHSMIFADVKLPALP